MISRIVHLLNCIQYVWCFTINIYGDTYIDVGVPYIVTCNVSEFKENRITTFNARISDTDQLSFTIRNSTTFGCYYLSGKYVRCQSSLCSCDMDGLATHWTYNTSADLSSPVTFRCTSSDNNGALQTSNPWTPTAPYGPGSSISFNPTNESITKVLGQSLGPIVCSAQCIPPCQFHWIKTDGTVVDESTLEIQSLSKNDHGTFTCHTGNGYGNNGTQNLNVTVNYGPEYVTLSPHATTYTVTEGDTMPSISCTALCRPQCTFMWTGPNVPGGTTNDLYLQNMNRNQAGTFYCTATNYVGGKVSSNLVVDIQYGPRSSIAFNPADESILKVLGQSLAPIVCSALCNPPCQFHWIKPDGTVVDRSNLEIPRLSKNDHGTFTCHAGNGYGNNATKNLQLTVHYGPEFVTLSPPTTAYTVTEGDNMPYISCSTSCRPQCTYMWNGPNVPDGTTDVLYLQNINRNQKRTFNCTATNEVGSKVSSTVEVDVRHGPGSSISFNPADEAIIEIQGQSIGPIVCSAQCNPHCQFYWIKPDETVVDGSNLEIPNLSKNDHGIFTCHAGNGYSNNATKNLLLTVNYGPESVTLSPPTKTYTVTEGDTLPSISCTASCRPQCTFMWTGPNVPDGTTNDLYLQNINRNQKGTFNCTATNEVGSKMSSNVEVDVQYQAKVENVAVNTTNTVEENTTVMFTCLFEGNPVPIVTWSLNGKILQTTEGSTTMSSFMVDYARCSNTGRYICTANNIIGNSKKELVLYVTCHPRSTIILDTTIVITNKQRTINITVPIISYPLPTLIRWTFIQNGTTDTTNVDSKYITTMYGVYQHVSQLIKDSVMDSEYGLYSIKVSNNIDPDFTPYFRVVEENKPTAPTVLYVVCKTTSAVVLWKSKFNGGSQQGFHVKYWRISQSATSILSPSIPDSGATADLQYTVNNLVPETIYIFQIIARNYLGDSLSKQVKCTTDQTQVQKNPASASQESNALFTAGISSLIISVLAIVFVIVFVLICRSRIQKKEQMRNNDYTEFTKCTHCNPVVTDNYDSINTTVIGPADINETQTDRNVDTYEECLPVTNTDHTDNSLNKQPKEKKKLKKKEEIYDNMNI